MFSRLWVKYVNAAVIALLLVSLFSACRRSTNVNADANAEPIRPMRIVTDDLDRKITIPVKVTRMVSLAPNLTESIFAVGAGDRLVGVTTFCNYPEQAKEIAKIGDTMTPNMESIVALKPDIVFVSTASQIENFTKTLEANGIAVYVTNPTSLDGIVKNLSALTEIFGTQNVGEEFISDLQLRIMCLQQSGGIRRNYRTFVQISKEPLFTIGKQSFLTSVLPLAYGESVTSNVESAYPKLSKESARALNPEMIILSDSEDNREPNEVFKDSVAVKESRVYRINADLLSRPGPRLVDALEQILRNLNPDKCN